MSDAFYGQINILPYTFAPVEWAYCNGATVPIVQYQALYAVIGINYGGNATSNFKLPNLNDKVPLGYGHGPGLSTWLIGMTGGFSTIGLGESNLPIHTHGAKGCNSIATNESTPTNASYVGFMDKKQVSSISGYIDPEGLNTGAMDYHALTSAGGGNAHENRQPVLYMNYCICVEGVWPQRP